MPIKIPSGLPAAEVLQSENIFVMDELRATAQDILNRLNGENVPTKTTTLTVDLDETGKMIESREFVDAMYGGLLTYLDRFVLEREELG